MKQATVFVAEQRTNVGAECAVVRSGGELVSWHGISSSDTQENWIY